MPEFEPTPAQKNAINASGEAILVSAGAGSGKTKVLTERLLKRISDPEAPVDIDRFLIITFTNAAAGELRSRIMDELSSLLEKDPGNMRLRKQSALCLRAQIGTIHSFCGRVIRDNSHVLGIAPDFKICDEERAKEMRLNALERVLDDRYARMDKFPGFESLADTVGSGRDDSRLAELVLQLHGKMQAHARPERWAKTVVTQLKGDFTDAGETIWGSYLLDKAKVTVDYRLKELSAVYEQLPNYPKMEKAYGKTTGELLDGMREVRRRLELGWDKTCEAFPIEESKAGSPRNLGDEEKLFGESFKAKRKASRDAMKVLEGQFSASSSELAEQMSSTAPAMEALLALTKDFDARYAEYKRRNGLLDYSDLEHMAVKLLTNEDDEPTELARELSDSFSEVMVDEFQDVSRVQDAIFTAVSDNRHKLFMVGDVKQSIYRFRLADPEIFTEKYLNYKDYGESDGNGVRILLRENFRSRKEILEAANLVFGMCMTRELGDVDYDEHAALVHGAKYYSGEVPIPELILIDKASGGTLVLDGEGAESMGDTESAQDTVDASDTDTPTEVGLEAEYVARRIRDLVRSGMTVGSKESEHKLDYKDIAILHRSANSVGPIFRKALSSLGIPVTGTGGTDFFATHEVGMLMALLTVTDNPHQDIPLLTVLRSPMFRFTPDELSAVRANDKDVDIYDALLLAAEHDEHCAEVVETLRRLRTTAVDMTPAELVWHIISNMNLTAICSAMPDGAVRRAHLLEFVELAESFEASGYHGLHRFLLWIQRRIESGNTPADASGALSSVQMLSIHKSKGLEFPIVFLCGCGRKFNMKDSSDTVIVHDALGLGPKVTDMVRHIEYPTLARNAIAARIKHETRSEEMRLLYVAMTRPKERLFMTGVVSKPEEKIRDAENELGPDGTLSPELAAGASSYMKWLLYAAVGNEDRNIRLVVEKNIVTAADTENTITSKEEGGPVDIGDRLAFVYPHAAAEQLPSKVTATELKNGDVENDEDVSLIPKRRSRFRMPDFARGEKPASGTERGIATHLVLQHINFALCGSLEGIKNEIARLRMGGYISEREADCVDPMLLQKLFESETGRLLLSAGNRMKREFKFSLLVDAGEVFGEAKGEKMLLQGVVDCCVEEDDGLVIIDYKTDAVKTAEELEARTELYRGQVKTYATAMRRITGKRVKACVLYYIRAGEARKITIDD